MAELLIRIQDKARGYKQLGWYHTKAGDVIVVKGDGHRWGKKEVVDPYRVFQLPEYPTWMFNDIVDVAEKRWGEVVQKSMFHFDVGRSWVRPLILSGGVIRLTGRMAMRFLEEKRPRTQANEIIVRAA